jgi:adhesin transport system outer membrane protein
MQDARTLVEEQAKNTFEQLQVAQENAGFLDNQANIAGEFLALAREERQLGRRSLIDVLSGETAEINALSDAETAKSQVAITAYTLLFILGKLDISSVKVAAIIVE